MNPSSARDCEIQAPGQVSGGGVVGCVGEGLEIASAVEQLVFQSEVTEQRAGDRLALLDDRFGQRCRAAQYGGDDVGHPAQITQRGADQVRTFVRVRRVRRQFFTHRFVAGLHLPSLRDLHLGVGELLQRAQLGDDLLGGRVNHCSPVRIVSGAGVLGRGMPRSRVGESSLSFGRSSGLQVTRGRLSDTSTARRCNWLLD